MFVDTNKLEVRKRIHWECLTFFRIRPSELPQVRSIKLGQKLDGVVDLPTIGTSEVWQLLRWEQLSHRHTFVECLRPQAPTKGAASGLGVVTWRDGDVND